MTYGLTFLCKSAFILRSGGGIKQDEKFGIKRPGGADIAQADLCGQALRVDHHPLPQLDIGIAAIQKCQGDLAFSGALASRSFTRNNPVSRFMATTSRSDPSVTLSANIGLSGVEPIG